MERWAGSFFASGCNMRRRRYIYKERRIPLSGHLVHYVDLGIYNIYVGNKFSK
jgi:hypothetical protein